MYLVTRRAIGAWYFRKKMPQDIQTAIKWDPGNPEYYDDLATVSYTHLDVYKRQLHRNKEG